MQNIEQINTELRKILHSNALQIASYSQNAIEKAAPKPSPKVRINPAVNISVSYEESDESESESNRLSNINRDYEISEASDQDISEMKAKNKKVPKGRNMNQKLKK